MTRSVIGALIGLTLALGVAVGVGAGLVLTSSEAEPSSGAALGSPTAGAPATATPEPTPTPSPTPTPLPSYPPLPTPAPTPALVAAPLTGRMVSEARATRHVVAVMIDDQAAARPQSGLTSASVVWQAPAEGGIPRYMALFQEGNPKAVGPVRSSRYYFIAWASEWRASYVHVGGSPQALAFLRSSKGKGSYVYDADGFRYEGRYLWRVTSRFAPHNVYTDGENLRKLAKVVGAKATTYKPAWTFAPDIAPDRRPKGGTIVVPYLANRITYKYDRVTNRYLRSVSGEKKQTDAASKSRVAPKNVIVMFVRFGPLNDGSSKNRLEARFTGSGRAYIATNGSTVKGTWKKASVRGKTRFYGPDGKPVVLTIGQTFIQVVPTGTKLTIKDGKDPPPTASGNAGARGALEE